MRMHLLIAVMVLVIAVGCLKLANAIHQPDCKAIGYDTAVITSTGVFCERTERIKLVDFEGMAQ